MQFPAGIRVDDTSAVMAALINGLTSPEGRQFLLSEKGRDFLQDLKNTPAGKQFAQTEAGRKMLPVLDPILTIQD